MQINNLGSNNKQSSSNAKKYILIGLIISVVLLLILLVVSVLYSSMAPKNLQLLVNGNGMNFTQDTFLMENGKIYVSLKDIANLIDYRYYEGGYKEFTQDKSKCYLQSEDEIVVYELGKNTIKKTLNDNNILYSEFEIKEPVRKNNDKLYCLASDLMIGCNLAITYNEETNVIDISTLQKLYEQYNDNAKQNKYTNVKELDNKFNNKKAILYGMLVVSDTETENNQSNKNAKYGVISLDGTKTYLDIKYDEIDFVEILQQFIVKAENKYGVVDNNGSQKIKLEYDEIKLFDGIEKLYYVERNNKKGILDEFGDALGGNLYVEFDELGINASLFPNDNIGNSMLLYNTVIPAKRGNNWGLFNIEGELVSGFEWDEFGYIANKEDRNNNNNSKNILLVPSMEGIVVCKNGKYGIINLNGKLLAVCEFDRIYSETIGGKEKFYLQYGNNVIDIENYEEDKQTTTPSPSPSPEPTFSPSPSPLPTSDDDIADNNDDETLPVDNDNNDIDDDNTETI